MPAAADPAIARTDARAAAHSSQAATSNPAQHLPGMHTPEVAAGLLPSASASKKQRHSAFQKPCAALQSKHGRLRKKSVAAKGAAALLQDSEACHAEHASRMRALSASLRAQTPPCLPERAPGSAATRQQRMATAAVCVQAEEYPWHGGCAQHAAVLRMVAGTQMASDISWLAERCRSASSCSLCNADFAEHEALQLLAGSDKTSGTASGPLCLASDDSIGMLSGTVCSLASHTWRLSQHAGPMPDGQSATGSAAHGREGGCKAAIRKAAACKPLQADRLQQAALAIPSVACGTRRLRAMVMRSLCTMAGSEAAAGSGAGGSVTESKDGEQGCAARTSGYVRGCRARRRRRELQHCEAALHTLGLSQSSFAEAQLGGRME